MLEVLIIGAGPTGLMLGLLLNRLGVKFRIIDENPRPAKESRAIAIQARSMEIFTSLDFPKSFLTAA
jgi:2-polyprenyl-6-methoxyphenol hydroxylase-like FAD-dependent oxidoreductase